MEKVQRPGSNPVHSNEWKQVELQVIVIMIWSNLYRDIK